MLIKFSIFVSNVLLIQHDSEMDERGWESNQAYLFTLFPLFFIKKTKCQHVISSDSSTQCICNDDFNGLLELMAEQLRSSNKFSICIQYKSALYLSVIKYDSEQLLTQEIPYAAWARSSAGINQFSTSEVLAVQQGQSYPPSLMLHHVCCSMPII